MQEEGIIKMDEVLKDFEKMNDKKNLKKNINMKFITLNLKKAGELIFQTTQIQEKGVHLKERAERTLKKKSFDFIKKGKKSKIGLI